MKTIRKLFWIGGLACPVISLWLLNSSIAAPPGLSIALTGSNSLTLVVTNGVSNGLYQLYFTEFMSTNPSWVLLADGTSGQTQFEATIGDLQTGFFKAVNNTNFVPPTISVIIQSPLNGSVLQ